MSTSPFAASFEALEPRLAPAGIITATFANGVLTLTGDAADNGLVMTQTAPDTVHIDGYEGTLIKLNGAAPVSAIDLTGAIKNLTADFKGGADHLITNDLAVTGNFTVNLGEGDGNSLESGNLSVGGAFKVTGGSGLDGVNCTGLTVGGATTLALGAGTNETFLLTSDSTPALTLGKGFSYTGGAGSDIVSLSATDGNLHIGGGLTINAGAGSAAIDINTSSVLDITGSLSITTGAHPEGEAATVNISAPVVDIGGSATVRNGPGPLAFSLNSAAGGYAHIGGSFSLTNSTNADGSTVEIHSNATYIGGSFGLALGNGSTTVNVDGGQAFAPAGSFIVAGGFSLSHGNGAGIVDQVSFAELSIGGRLSIATGSGASQISFVAGKLHALGGISASHATSPFNPNGIFTGFNVQELIAPSITIANGNGSFVNSLYVGDALISGGISIRNGSVPTDGLSLTELGGSWDIGGSLEYSTGAGNASFNIYGGAHFRVAKDLKVTGGSTSNPDLGGGFGISSGAAQIGGDLTVRFGNGVNNIALVADNLAVGDDLSLYLGDITPGYTSQNSIGGGGTLHVGGDLNFRAGAGEVSIVTSSAVVDIAGSATLTTGAYRPGAMGVNYFAISGGELAIRGPVLINNSAGGPSLTEINAAVVRLDSGLTVLNGAGNDIFNLQTASGEIGGNLALRNGTGSSETHIHTSTDGNLTLRGALIVTSLAGDDVLDLAAGGAIYGGIAASFGASDTVGILLSGDASDPNFSLAINGAVSLTAAANAARTLGITNATLQSSLAFTGGSASDTVGLYGSTFAGPVSLSLQGGDDLAQIDRCTFRGAFTLAGGDGSDQLNLATIDPGPLQFLGPVTVRLGGGDDDLTISEAGAPVLFHSRVLFDGGAGVNTLDANITPTPTGNQPVFLAGLPTVSHFDIP